MLFSQLNMGRVSAKKSFIIKAPKPKAKILIPLFAMLAFSAAGALRIHSYPVPNL